MTLNIAISGLNSANKDLTIIGNNIANANTVGFKSARANFADIYQASLDDGSILQLGSGVNSLRTTQSFSQGNAISTGNNLDLNIDGQGFFVFDNSGKTQYSRAGLLSLSKNNQLVNAQGYQLQGYAASDAGVLSGNVSGLSISNTTLAAKQTDTASLDINLDSAQTVPVNTTFSAEDSSSYNNAASTPVFDALGNQHTLNLYFVKQADNATYDWKVYAKIDGQDVGAATGLSASQANFGLSFNADGSIDKANSQTIKIVNWKPIGNTAENISVDVDKLAQSASEFSIKNIAQNGFSTGQFQNLTIASDGQVTAQYSNGQNKLLGQLALANFSNVYGLDQAGDASWVSTDLSGAANVSTAGKNGLGDLQSGFLENSNVDLSNQLVSLIIAQRNFQANSRSIQAEDEIAQSIINMH